MNKLRALSNVALIFWFCNSCSVLVKQTFMTRKKYDLVCKNLNILNFFFYFDDTSFFIKTSSNGYVLWTTLFYGFFVLHNKIKTIWIIFRGTFNCPDWYLFPVLWIHIHDICILLHLITLASRIQYYMFILFRLDRSWEITVMK